MSEERRLREVYHDEDDIRPRKSEGLRKENENMRMQRGVWHTAGYSTASAATALTV
jgi:hypothetical protein